MWQIPLPEHPPFPPYVRYPKLFSKPECEAIIAAGEAKGFQPGTIGNGSNDVSVLDHGYRVVQNAFLKPLDPATGMDLQWVFERLESRVVATNRDFFRFDLTGFDEGLTFLKYEAQDGDSPAGHYKWHQDFGGGRSSHRKLSIVTQLSPRDTYQGCRLKLFTNMEFEPEDFIEQGDTIIFPSWTSHMVEPITMGARYAMAVWVAGPQFR